MFILPKPITYTYYMVGRFVMLLFKTTLGFILNNIPWHISYAMVLGLKPTEVDEHRLKDYGL